MRFWVVLLVMANLLLRGAAVPHVHSIHADPDDDSARPHVHLSGGSPHRSHAHGHHSHGRHGHKHRHESAARGALIGSTAAPAPAHDDDAVYLDDDGLIRATAERRSTSRAGVEWLADSAGNAASATSLLVTPLRRVRPPGDVSPANRSLFPHVLRV